MIPIRFVTKRAIARLTAGPQFGVRGLAFSATQETSSTLGQLFSLPLDVEYKASGSTVPHAPLDRQSPSTKALASYILDPRTAAQEWQQSLAKLPLEEPRGTIGGSQPRWRRIRPIATGSA